MARQVVLGVTGSIAAYKAADLTRRMIRAGWEVRVVMTRAATEFVGEITFRTLSRHAVAVDMFGPCGDWKPEHISLGQWAEVMVIAPCTANVMAKLAHGLADDLLSCTALACRAPLVVAPAMNEAMWEHPATKANAALLKERGVRIVEVGKGDLACGEGKGRMADTEEIMASITDVLREAGEKRT